MSKMSWRFKRMLPIYKLFAEPWSSTCDFSEESALVLYDYESKGKGDLSIDIYNKTHNGYMVGKKWLNVQVSAWIEDLSIFIFKDGYREPVKNPHYEGWYNVLKRLYTDTKFPHWWLNEIFDKWRKDIKGQYELMGLGEDFNKAYEEAICIKLPL
jgi:hypothetical protein